MGWLKNAKVGDVVIVQTYGFGQNLSARHIKKISGNPEGSRFYVEVEGVGKFDVNGLYKRGADGPRYNPSPNLLPPTHERLLKIDERKKCDEVDMFAKKLEKLSLDDKVHVYKMLTDSGVYDFVTKANDSN